MNLQNIMLSGGSQTQEDKYCIISPYEVSGIAKLTETESRLGIARGSEECRVGGYA